MTLAACSSASSAHIRRTEQLEGVATVLAGQSRDPRGLHALFRRSRVSPTTWQAVGASLPASAVAAESITRQDGFNLGKLPQTDSTNWQLFSASFAFRYGTDGYGPSRFGTAFLKKDVRVLKDVTDARLAEDECATGRQGWHHDPFRDSGFHWFVNVPGRGTRSNAMRLYRFGVG